LSINLRSDLRVDAVIGLWDPSYGIVLCHWCGEFQS